MNLGYECRTLVEWQLGHAEIFQPRFKATTTGVKRDSSAMAPKPRTIQYRILMQIASERKI
jgi:hypothetical protein